MSVGLVSCHSTGLKVGDSAQPLQLPARSRVRTRRLYVWPRVIVPLVSRVAEAPTGTASRRSPSIRQRTSYPPIGPPVSAPAGQTPVLATIEFEICVPLRSRSAGLPIVGATLSTRIGNCDVRCRVPSLAVSDTTYVPLGVLGGTVNDRLAEPSSWPVSFVWSSDAPNGEPASTDRSTSPGKSSARTTETGTLRDAPAAPASDQCELPGVASSAKSPRATRCDTSSSGSWTESGSLAVFQSLLPAARSAARTSAGVASGLEALYSAAAPVTCGAAMDVPLM